jgi:hypothetical protein
VAGLQQLGEDPIQQLKLASGTPQLIAGEQKSSVSLVFLVDYSSPSLLSKQFQ